MHNNHSSCRLAARHVPVEICENIIDQLYSPYEIWDQVEHVRALRRCALVCKDWRVRSQMRLFYSVVLHDLAAVYKIAAVLETGPHLRDYVHEVTLVGSTMHTTASPVSHFLIALYRKLPRLEDLRITRQDDVSHWTLHAHQGVEPGTEKQLQFLPLHPRFPVFLSAFATIARLVIFRVTFQHFGELLKVTTSLPELQDLYFERVQCAILGPLPAGADAQTNASRSLARRRRPVTTMHLLVGISPYRRDVHTVTQFSY